MYVNCSFVRRGGGGSKKKDKEKEKHPPIISRDKNFLLGRGDFLEGSSGESDGFGNRVIDAEKIAARDAFEVLKLVVFAFSIINGSIRTELFDHLQDVYKTCFLLPRQSEILLTDAVFAEHVATTL